MARPIRVRLLLEEHDASGPWTRRTAPGRLVHRLSTRKAIADNMAIIHHTTLTPSKLELVAPWLPAQPWYRGSGHQPALTKAGGFRLDDPEGEVGIEFMAVTDTSGSRITTYHIPLTYRGSVRSDGDVGLIGTAEHGVLGRRWVYDGSTDVVLIAQLIALIQGQAEAQAQSESNTSDPTVQSKPVSTRQMTPVNSATTMNGPQGTEIEVKTADGALILRLNRMLKPDAEAIEDIPGLVTATWRLDGTPVRSVFATAQLM